MTKHSVISTLLKLSMAPKQLIVFDFDWYGTCKEQGNCGELMEYDDLGLWQTRTLIAGSLKFLRLIYAGR